MCGCKTHLPGAEAEPLNYSCRWAVNPSLLIYFYLAEITCSIVRREQPSPTGDGVPAGKAATFLLYFSN